MINKQIRLILATCVLSTIAACAPVDRWGAVQPDYEALLRRTGTPPIEIPEEVLPSMAQPVPLPVPAEGQALPLSVEEAIMISLQYNRDLHVRQLNPVIAGTFEQIARGVFDPEVFAEMQYYRERASETSRATGEQFGTQGSDTSVVAGVRQSLPTGTELEATVEHERNLSNRTPDQQTARVGLSVTQSLLRGFGPAVNMIDVRQAALDHSASLYELRGYIEALVADTEIAYWNYVLAEQEIAIFENAAKVASQQRDEIEQRIAVGVLPRIEAAASRAEVALREQALIDARSQLESQRLRLVRLLGPGAAAGLDLQVRPTTGPAIDAQPITDLPERLQLAEQARPDINEARLRLQQDRLEVLVTKNGLLPRLELFAGLGRTGYADTFSQSVKELDGDTYDFTAGLRFSHFLGNRSAEARHVAARATRRQSAEAVANLLQIVRLDVHLAATEVERTRQQISATAATRALQEQTLVAEKERFDVGASTSLLVAQAQRDLLTIQIAEVEAVINYRTALVQLYLSEGSLLERRGIRLGDPQRP
ncbi:MAG: transporter [Desulfatitalea sp. BRH_c12]|nr:MAG: transporter [Desulfatitalea sp. BRH_c12]